MKKIALSLITFSSCFAADIAIGGNYTYMRMTPEGLERFHGNLGGVQASFECRDKDAFYQGATFLWREGSLKGNAPFKRSIFNVDTQLRAGYTLGMGCNFAGTLFTGFGWEYIGQGLTGGIPLDLNYNEVYIPVGVLTRYAKDKFSIGLNGIWMPQIFPTVNFVPLDNARWVTDCTLANFLVELPIGYRVGDGTWCWNGLIEVRPFFQFWQDGATLATTSTGIPLGLPKNTYYLGGVQLNLGIEF